MRVDPDGTIGRPSPPLSSATPGSRAASAAPISRRTPTTTAAVPLSADRIDEHRESGTDAISALGNWAQNEWSTLAGAAHGLASAPGLVSRSWQDAAETNGKLAAGIRTAVNGWDHKTAADRQAAIDGLQKAAAHVSRTARCAGDELARANRLPLAVETALGAAIDGLPKGVQGAAKALAGAANLAIGKLPAPIESRALGAAHDLDLAATAQAAKAAGGVAAFSRRVGMSVAEATSKAGDNTNVAGLLTKAPFLRDAPAVGVVLTGAGIALDVRGGKSLADAAVANVAGTIAGTLAGGAFGTGLAAVVRGAAITDATAELVGAAAATGPVGWAVAGGIVVGAAVGYGVIKGVESGAGQDVINGVMRFDGHAIERGMKEASGIGEAR